MLSKFRIVAVASLILSLGSAAVAQSNELSAAQLAVIKTKLAQRVPDLPPVESARTTPMAGLIEVKVGSQVVYTDATGEYVIEGQVLETKTQRNLTQERMEDIHRAEFSLLPFKDAVVWKVGTGKRRMVVFSDPNCGYCKHLEKELQQIKDVTVYTFMIPILGEDSRAKVGNIWCVKDRTQAWRDWMLNGSAPSRAFGACASPVDRNLALAKKWAVNGTPAMIFEDGSLLASFVQAGVIEQRLRKASAKIGG
jgi:thiol:disulfide interchange protein DsbC